MSNADWDKTRDAALRNLISVVSEQDAAKVGLDADLSEALGLDSLAGLRVLAAIEKRYGIRFPDHRLGEYRTLNQIRAFIDAQESERKS